jgi:hypothetical protein
VFALIFSNVKVEVAAANDSQIAKTAVTQAVAEATALPLAA